MIVGYLLLGVFAVCGDSRPPQPGTPAPNLNMDTPLLVEGDIAVIERSSEEGNRTAMNTFRTAEESVWPKGIIRYRFDVDQWDGEPVFFQHETDKITEAIRKIENGVPCIEFRFVRSTFSNKHKGQPRTKVTLPGE